jgi:hypothetical protein
MAERFARIIGRVNRFLPEDFRADRRGSAISRIEPRDCPFLREQNGVLARVERSKVATHAQI